MAKIMQMRPLYTSDDDEDNGGAVTTMVQYGLSDRLVVGKIQVNLQCRYDIGSKIGREGATSPPPLSGGIGF